MRSLRASCPNNIQTTSVINTVQIPPWLTAEIWQHNLVRTEDIFISVLVRVIKTVQQKASKGSATVEETMATLECDRQLPFELLFSTLHNWSTLPKALGFCLFLATFPEASEIHEDLHEALLQDSPPDELDQPSFHFCCRCLISKPRQVLGSSSKTTRGVCFRFFISN